MDSTDHKKFLLGNYASPALEIIRGEGAKLWDSQEKEFLDFTSGIAVTNIGHCHPHWIEQINKQAEKIVHCSNLFSIPEQVRLAQRLVSEIGAGKMLFCNSGAEANEGLIKFARLASETPVFQGKSKSSRRKTRFTEEQWEPSRRLLRPNTARGSNRCWTVLNSPRSTISKHGIASWTTKR